MLSILCLLDYLKMTADFLFCFILFLFFCNSLVKQSKFGDATAGFPDK